MLSKQTFSLHFTLSLEILIFHLASFWILRPFLIPLKEPKQRLKLKIAFLGI